MPALCDVKSSICSFVIASISCQEQYFFIEHIHPSSHRECAYKCNFVFISVFCFLSAPFICYIVRDPRARHVYNSMGMDV